MSKAEELSKEQWAVLEPLIPLPAHRADGRGRPWIGNRAVLNGILWVLRTGAPWADLPDRFPSYQTCHRRFQHWVSTGMLRRVLEALARDLEERGAIDVSECFIDGTFSVAKKGALRWGKPSGTRVQRSGSLQTLRVFHSPCTRLLLHHMKSPLSRQRWLKPSPWDDPNDLSGIAPTTVIRSITYSLSKALISLRRTVPTEPEPQRRTAVPCAAIVGAGRSNAASPGLITSGEPSFDGSVTLKTSELSFNSLAQ